MPVPAQRGDVLAMFRIVEQKLDIARPHVRE
jgi:hypothetical protein